MKKLIYSSILLMALQIQAQNPIVELYTQSIFKINPLVSIANLKLDLTNIDLDFMSNSMQNTLKSDEKIDKQFFLKSGTTKEERTFYYAALITSLFACALEEDSAQCRQDDNDLSFQSADIFPDKLRD